MVSVDYLNRRSFAKVTDQGGYGKAGLTADLARIAAVACASLLCKRRSSTDSRLHREMSGRSSSAIIYLGASRPGGLLFDGDPEVMSLSQFAFQVVEKGGRLAIATLARQFGGEKSRFVGRSSQPSFERRDAAAPPLHNLRRLSGQKNGAEWRS
jgi:hypothetical protein